MNIKNNESPFVKRAVPSALMLNALSCPQKRQSRTRQGVGTALARHDANATPVPMTRTLIP